MSVVAVSGGTVTSDGHLPAPGKHRGQEASGVRPMSNVSQEKVLIRNRIDNRMIDSMEVASVLAIAGAVIGTADDKGAAPHVFPFIKEPPKLPVHIPEGRLMAVQAVMFCAVQVEIIGVMDGIHIQVEEKAREIFWISF